MDRGRRGRSAYSTRDGRNNHGSVEGMSVEDGRKWWAFQPVQELPAPKVKDAKWARTKIDAFILARLEAKKLKPSPAADRRDSGAPRLCRSGGVQADLRRG